MAVLIEKNPKGLIEESEVEFNEILSNGLGELTIIERTVPVGKNLFIKKISFSGENVAVFKTLINDTEKLKTRTYFTEYNSEIDFKNVKLIEGDNLKIKVENKSSSAAIFNTTLFFIEVDAE